MLALSSVPAVQVERLQQEQLFGALSGAGVNDDTLHAVRGNEDFMRASLYYQRKLDGEGGAWVEYSGASFGQGSSVAQWLVASLNPCKLDGG